MIIEGNGSDVLYMIRPKKNGKHPKADPGTLTPLGRETLESWREGNFVCGTLQKAEIVGKGQTFFGTDDKIRISPVEGPCGDGEQGFETATYTRDELNAWIDRMLMELSVRQPE